jgi:16S rRNA C967 or C1407 C5-methylase (RsmB/RsmF family)
VIDYLVNKYPSAKVVKSKLPGLKTSPAVMEFNGMKYNSQVKNVIRLWPQDNDTEGFFVAKIKKLNIDNFE